MPRLKYSSFRRWNKESTLVAANAMSLTVNLAGFGRRWIRFRMERNVRIITEGLTEGCDLLDGS